MRSIVDLTQHLEDGMAVFPGIASPSFRDIARVVDDGYAMSEYHLVNHIGTQPNSLRRRSDDRNRATG